MSYDGIHGDVVRVDLAALCALNLEVPCVVLISGDEVRNVLEFGFDLKGKDRLQGDAFSGEQSVVKIHYVKSAEVPVVVLPAFPPWSH